MRGRCTRIALRSGWLQGFVRQLRERKVVLPVACAWKDDVESFELTVRPEPRENKQAQTRAVSRLYSHQCGGNMQVLRGVRSDG